MKLQLNESTLNAYINEAIKQELEENWLTKAVSKVGSKAGKAVKGAARGAKTYAKALGGNKKAVQKSEKMLKSLKDELAAVEKEQKAIWGTANSGARGHELATRRNTLIRRIKSVESSLAKAKAGKTLARTATGTAAAGFGAGYLAGRSGKNGQNPDAPWNDGIADPGMNDGGFDDNGGNDGGFDGTFPWDNTDPAWTPRPARNPQPQPGQTQDNPTQEEPQQPVRRSMEALQPVSTINVPTGVTGTSETLPGLKQRPESFVDSARRVMAQTAAAGLNGNTGNPKLDNWRQTNRNTRKTANAAIDTMRRDGAITRDQARQDKRTIKDTERTIRRNAKEMQNQGQ